jgi:hypothetical protein
MRTYAEKKTLPMEFPLNPNETGNHWEMNHDAFGIDSKLNANSIFVRVPYIRARINKNKNKDIYHRKKSRRRRLEKRPTSTSTIYILIFCFLLFRKR